MAKDIRFAQDTRKALETGVNKLADTKRRTLLPDVLSDANSKDRSKCEVFLVEGESAAGSTIEARDRAT